MTTTHRELPAPAGDVDPPAPTPGVDLYWIPLGAGARIVRASGRTFEALSAFLQRRERRDLYHSALGTQE